MPASRPSPAATPSRAVRRLALLGLLVLALAGTAPLASGGAHEPPHPAEQIAVAGR